MVCSSVLYEATAVHSTWHGMVWYGMVWYGMVWYGMVEVCEGAPVMLLACKKRRSTNKASAKHKPHVVVPTAANLRVWPGCIHSKRLN